MNFKLSEMYGNKWENVEGLTEAEINEIEKNTQLSLPGELKEVIKNCSGSRPFKDFYENGDIELSIGYMLPARPDKKRGDLLSCYQRLTETYHFPKHIFPFATDKGHANFICLDTNNEEVIYYLTDVQDNNMRKVASSILEFIHNLSEPVY